MTVLTVASCLGQPGCIQAAKKYGVLMSTLHAPWVFLYSGLTLEESQSLAAASHGLCSCSAFSGLSRCLKGSQRIHTRATLG